MANINVIVNLWAWPYFSTRVECGGLCASKPECGAFYFDGETCGLLKAPDIFLNGDDTSPQEVYMLNNLNGVFPEVKYWNEQSNYQFNS